MNALTLGLLIILFILLGNSMATFIQTGATTATNVPGCSASDNLTECNDVGETSFVSAVLQTTVNGIQGAPAWFNVFWLLVNVGLLVLAGLLIVTYFLGVFFGGTG